MLDLLPIKRRQDVPQLFKEMEDMVKHFWELFPDEGLTGDLTFDWSPRLDIAESEHAIEVKVELPGLEKKDIDISLDGEMLVIKGEKRHEKEEKGKKFHRIERSYGSFHRTLRLPVGVMADKIEAAYTDGVLIITLPKTEEAKKRIAHIDVH